MTLIPLKLPAGVYRNGTEFEASNRWRDASLVRWVDNTMRPVGGWEERDAMDSVAIRGMHAWTDLSSDQRIASGSYNKLAVATASGTVTDITPVSFTDGTEDAEINTGYGGGFYGAGYYGTTRLAQGQYGEATTWSLDNWGEYLVACSNADGQLLEWQLNVANPAVAISNAPTSNLGLVVTEERFLFALGAGGNPRKVQWCDREDNTLWTPAATNEAGDIELATSGQIMQGIRTRGQTLIITDLDAHSATYIGGQFVYGFQRVGSSCGATSRRAAAAVDEGVFWMGQRGFFQYSGGAVRELPCDVADYVFNGINRDQISKVWAVSNQQYNEIWWFYPSANSLEIDRYVVLNYTEGHWAIGTLSRTAGVDRGIFSSPIWADADGQTYNHEFGLNYDGALSFAESGPISLGNGDNVMKATMLIPDEKTQGGVQAVFKTRFYPNDTETLHGPYVMENPTSVRFTGRQIRLRVQSPLMLNDTSVVDFFDAALGGSEPEYFIANQADASGRLYFDIDNSGAVDAFDAFILLAYSQGTLFSQEYKSYIENTLQPYLLSLYNDYPEVQALYDGYSSSDWRVGVMRLDAVAGGKR